MLHAHSALRYLVLGLGLACLVFFTLGLTQKRPYSKTSQIFVTIFAGLTHLQATLGLAMVAMGFYYPRLIGHIVMMLAAAVTLQVLLIRNRKSTAPGYKLPLIGIVVALLLMTGGTFAIGRHPFQATVFGSAPATAPATP
ncbi:MAG: hypothetical protein GQE15_38950 [Archangiaceae bacterium]|mgnify:FL=1|nr:hypothetical protein [Archangiaceae bacterium]